jgi:hypothetical protein
MFQINRKEQRRCVVKFNTVFTWICAGLLILHGLDGSAQSCSTVRFSIPIAFSSGFYPVHLAAGDFNRDGSLDLAVAGQDNPNQPSDSPFVRVFLGNGRGQFYLVSSLNAFYPQSIRVADMNRDGKSDLVLSSPGPGLSSIALGNGDGVFQNPIFFAPGTPVPPNEFLAPGLAAVGDFNRDGLPDAAFPIGTFNSIGVGLGDGNGNLTLFGGDVPGGNGPVSLVTADFDRNGALDLAVADLNGGNAAVMLGDGLGNFGVLSSFSSAGNLPETLVVADFNRDGIDDLALANVGSADESSLGRITVLLGDGAGGFGQPLITDGVQPSFAPENRDAMVAGDFNHDAKLDLAVVEGRRNDVVILLGNGTGLFGAAKRFAAGYGPNSLVPADFNNDGKLDLAIGDFRSGKVSILLNTCW